MKRLIKTKQEIDLIRKSGHALATMIAELTAMVKPGVTTLELEGHALNYIKKIGAKPAFKGYKPDRHSQPFPSALCLSINDEIVHGPATPARVLKNGDIITIDSGIEYITAAGESGYFSDMAITVPVGEIPMKTRLLLTGTQESLEAGIAVVKPGATLLEIGTAIEKVLKKYKLGIIRDLVGHGVGLAVHEEPQVPNYAFSKNEFPNVVLKPGMVIAIEPMATLGDWRIDAADDGFTFVTEDGSLAAHFEHTVLVTETGYEILTKSA